MKWIKIQNQNEEEAWVTEFAWKAIQDAMNNNKVITFSTRVGQGSHPKKGKFGELLEFYVDNTSDGIWEKIGEEDV